MPKKRAIKSDDDKVLWRRVTSQVTPLKSTIHSAAFAALFSDPPEPQNKLIKESLKIPKKTAVTDESIHLGIIARKISTSKKEYTVDLRHGEKAGIDSRTKRRLIRGEVPIESRLDLHGMTAVRAHKQLTQFIEWTARAGCRCVLVITGKGSGVLHGNVPNWLKQPPLSYHVLALAEAKPKDGGSGALYVLLRRKRGAQ